MGCVQQFTKYIDMADQSERKVQFGLLVEECRLRLAGDTGHYSYYISVINPLVALDYFGEDSDLWWQTVTASLHQDAPRFQP